MPAINLFLFPSIREYTERSLKLHPIHFTTGEKAHYVAVDYANVFEI